MIGRGLLLCVLALRAFVSPATAAIVGFTETFSGSGSYDSLVGDFSGLDNPGWRIGGDGELTDDGYAFQNIPGCCLDTPSDRITRSVTGAGSFRERIVVRNLDLGEVGFLGIDDFGAVGFTHFLGGGGAFFGGRLIENDGTEPGRWSFAVFFGEGGEVVAVERGTDVAIEMEYDHQASSVTFFYDNDVDDDDDVPPVVLGPFSFDGQFTDEQSTHWGGGAFGDGLGNGVLEHWSLTPFSNVPGDFNGNEVLDVGDIDLLSTEVNAATNDGGFDLNADSLVDDLDRTVWVHDLSNTYFGDTDLNGEFDSTDLVQVLSFGQYEDGVAMNSTWLTGDWDGNGDFASGDLVFALADGGYEQGPRAGVSAVPEPSSTVLLIAAVLMVVSRRRKPRPNAKAMRPWRLGFVWSVLSDRHLRTVHSIASQ